MLEEVEGEVEEEVLDLAEGSFKKLVIEWKGPDLVYTTVKDWILSDQAAGRGSPQPTATSAVAGEEPPQF